MCLPIKDNTLIKWIYLLTVPVLWPSLSIENTISGLWSGLSWRGTVILWTDISWYSTGLIITRPDNETVRDYICILSPEIHCIVRILFPLGSPIYVHERTPIHSAHFVQPWLMSMQMRFQVFLDITMARP